LVALACGVLFLTLARRYPVGPAALVAVVCGLATPLWSSASQALWSHAPAVLLLGAGLGILLTAPAGSEGRHRLLLIAGASLTLAVFCRQLLVVFPACAALALWRSQTPRSGLAMFGAGCALAVAAMVTANLLLLGSPLGGFVGLYSTGVTVHTHAVTSAWSGDWLS
jgi:4-amino-4-deoxy-L-arabinose transferase-like glycosyltransferase